MIVPIYRRGLSLDNPVASTLSTPLTATQRARISYRAAFTWNRQRRVLGRICWVTWIVTLVTIALWSLTAYQVALASGAHQWREIFHSMLGNAENSDVLIRYGAKENAAIQAGQYWRFLTPIFLHANLLHVGLNMLNFLFIGVFLERLVGHLRFLLLYLVTGTISTIASYTFLPEAISVGASGAIFGLVGAYSVFVLQHRRAFRSGGLFELSWLLIVISVNLCLGLFIAGVDNYAHLGGFLSGCVLGWIFMPYYRSRKQPDRGPNVHIVMGDISANVVDGHDLEHRWPLALLAIGVTLLVAFIVIHVVGG